MNVIQTPAGTANIFVPDRNFCFHPVFGPICFIITEQLARLRPKTPILMMKSASLNNRTFNPFFASLLPLHTNKTAHRTLYPLLEPSSFQDCTSLCTSASYLRSRSV